MSSCRETNSMFTLLNLWLCLFHYYHYHSREFIRPWSLMSLFVHVDHTPLMTYNQLPLFNTVRFIYDKTKSHLHLFSICRQAGVPKWDQFSQYINQEINIGPFCKTLNYIQLQHFLNSYFFEDIHTVSVQLHFLHWHGTSAWDGNHSSINTDVTPPTPSTRSFIHRVPMSHEQLETVEVSLVFSGTKWN